MLDSCISHRPALPDIICVYSTRPTSGAGRLSSFRILLLILRFFRRPIFIPSNPLLKPREISSKVTKGTLRPRTFSKLNVTLPLHASKHLTDVKLEGGLTFWGALGMWQAENGFNSKLFTTDCGISVKLA